MARDVCVIVVHGINTDLPGYSDAYEGAVKRALPKELRQHAIFREVFWAKHIRDRQKDYMGKAESAGLVRSDWRRLAVQALGDAAAYQKTRWLRNSSYYYVQQCILDILGYFERLDPRPVIFVGHSLGCHIISSFAWDVHSWRQVEEAEIEQEPDASVRALAHTIRNGSPMMRLETFAGLITLGSNMPMFTFTFGPERVFPITKARKDGWTPAFPGAGLSPALKERARWVNMFSPNDILGYPLRPLNKAYNECDVLTDIPVKVEGWIPNPYDAHVKYWTNKRVVRESADLIRSVIEAP